MADLLTLCQLLNSHLCHEIAGPILAINNSIDLIDSENAEIKNKAMELVSYANKQLVHKIKFYSHIYSSSANEGEYVALSIIKDLCFNFFENTDIKVEFNFQLSASILDLELSKLLMCLIVTAGKNLPKRGIIQIILKSSSNLLIKAKGEKLHHHPQIIKILNGDVQLHLDVFNCNEHYFALLNKKIGYKLFMVTFKDSIEYNLYKD